MLVTYMCVLVEACAQVVVLPGEFVAGVHGALEIPLVEVALLGALGVELGVCGGQLLLVLDAAAEAGGVHGGLGLGKESERMSESREVPRSARPGKENEGRNE